jgi:hypothetical protein
MSSIKIPKAAMELHRFTHKDSHKNISHVRFEFDHGTKKATGIVTDGHRMTVLSWVWDSEEDPGSQPIHITGSELKQVCSALSTKEHAILEWRPGDPLGTWHLPGYVTKHAHPDEQVNFPDWQAVLPKPTSPKEQGKSVALNPQYVEEALAHARKWVLPKPARRGTGDSYRFGLHAAVFELGFWGPNSPARIIARDPVNQVDATYIVMPMRL